MKGASRKSRDKLGLFKVDEQPGELSGDRERWRCRKLGVRVQGYV